LIIIINSYIYVWPRHFLPPKIRSERTAYGIKAYNRDGELYEDPVEEFLRAIDNGRKEKSRYQNQFDELYNIIVGDDGVLDRDNIRVLGVVVTGDKARLKSLEDLTFIRASSLGVVTDKY